MAYGCVAVEFEQDLRISGAASASLQGWVFRLEVEAVRAGKWGKILGEAKSPFNSEFPKGLGRVPLFCASLL